MTRYKPSPKWIVLILGVVLWGTMTLIPILRVADSPEPARALALSAASLVLTFLPLVCLAFGALREERILYQFLFPLLLLATQFATAATGWDEPIQYVPNGIVFAVYFVAAAFLGGAPARITPITTIPLNPTPSRTPDFRRTALIFLPHAVVILALAIALAVAPAWDTALSRTVDLSALIPFASVCLALAALAIHVGRAFYRARELSGYLRPNPLTAKGRWTPTRQRAVGTLVFLAVGIAIGLTLVWIR